MNVRPPAASRPNLARSSHQHDDTWELLSRAAFDPKQVGHYLDPDYAPMWARYDPELGYVLRDLVIRDGLDDCYTISRYEDSGQRRTINFREIPCRVHTYGDSFTQCHQVSDGETWQEYLAGHLGEPIRNFGIGGYGVYQAYRRARRIEAGDLGTEYIALNIFDDDHVRSIDACRRLRLRLTDGDLPEAAMFHATPWTHVRYDHDLGRFVERPSPCPTPEALRELCDPERFHEAFRDDEVIRLSLLQLGRRVAHLDDLQALADALDVDADLSDVDRAANDAGALHMAYALRSTEFVLDLVRDWITAEGKKLIVLLSYGYGKVRAALNGEPRFDQSLIDYLDRNEVPYVDALQSHVDDYRSFRVSPQEYIDRFYVGHYNPMGNHFFAFAVKDAIVDWLDPKPVTYRPGGAVMTEVAARGGRAGGN